MGENSTGAQEQNQNQTQQQTQQGQSTANQSGTANQNGQQEQQNGQNQASGQQNAQIDFEALQKMLAGTLEAKEKTALKEYFKQQGLSQEEAQQAIERFKAEKKKNTPNVEDLQNQIAEANKRYTQAVIENAASMEAIRLGVQPSTVPYLIKMADFNGVMGADGKVDAEKLTAAVNKVLTDIPALKTETEGAGFRQVGMHNTASGTHDSGSGTQQNKNRGDNAQKRWNRFN